MNCQNIFCVYNKKEKCTVEPEIGINGFCESCIYIDVTENQLDEIKEKMLSSWKAQDEE